MRRWLSYFDPNGRASGRRRTAAAIGLIALVAGPTFVLLLIGLLGITDGTVLMQMSGTAMVALAKLSVYGLVAGLPMAVVCAALICILARRGWDAIGVSLITGLIASVLLAAGLIYLALEKARQDRLTLDPELWWEWWEWPMLVTPFALTGVVMCALFWRIAIRHRRHARLRVLQDVDAIRAME